MLHDQPDEFKSGLARMAEMTDMVVEQIRKLAALRDEGILDDEEFEHKKHELLDRI